MALLIDAMHIDGTVARMEEGKGRGLRSYPPGLLPLVKFSGKLP